MISARWDGWLCGREIIWHKLVVVVMGLTAVGMKFLRHNAFIYEAEIDATFIEKDSIYIVVVQQYRYLIGNYSEFSRVKIGNYSSDSVSFGSQESFWNHVNQRPQVRGASLWA